MVNRVLPYMVVYELSWREWVSAGLVKSTCNCQPRPAPTKEKERDSAYFSCMRHSGEGGSFDEIDVVAEI